MSNLKLPIIGYLITIIALFFYSFTQIDLGLTLSEASIWQHAEKFFKNIGYFQRPLSGFLFTGIMSLLFVFYSLILYGVYKKKISRKAIWFLIISITAILTFSYNAFSHDLFNYIFDAKIVTYYQQNPFTHRALDFPGDPMLSFMHWTHRFFPYGPTWLGLTVPLSFLGFQFFLPTFFLFKILISVCFLGTVFFIGKILKRISPQEENFGIVFFALNPLVIIEGLVSSHNDMATVFFAMGSLYLLTNSKYVRSTILIILSIGVKFASIFLLPILAIRILNKNISWQVLFSLSTILMIFAVIMATVRTNFQPWYLLNVLPFAALVSKKYYIFIPSFIISLISAFEYLPFILLGNWDKPVPSILFWMTASAIVASMLLTTAWYFKLQLHNNQIK